MENTIISTSNPIKKKRGLVKGSQEAKDWAKKMMDARKVKSAKNKETEPKVNIDLIGENQLILPEYFAVKRKNGYKLVNPMTKERNLSKRGGETSVKILRKPVDDAVLLDGEDHLIPLSLFSKKDRGLIVAKFDKIEQNKDKSISEKPVIPMTPSVERGRPERLQRNIDINKERNQGVAKKGRPAKYKSQEEAKKAKSIKDKERYAKKQEAKKAHVVEGTGSIPRKKLNIIFGTGGCFGKMCGKKDMKILPVDSDNIELNFIDEPSPEPSPMPTPRPRGRPRTKPITDEDLAIISNPKTKPTEEPPKRLFSRKIPTNLEQIMKERSSKGKPKEIGVIGRNNSVISDLSNSSGDGVSQDINTIIHKGKTNINNIKSRVSNVAKEVYYGATNLPLPVQKILQKYGDDEIVSLKLMRTPVPKVLSGVLTLFSGGKFGERMKENDFDTLFHLFIEATLKNGTKIELEKNERITMLLNPKPRPKTEIEPIEQFPSNLTLTKLLKNTQQKMGKNFLSYSARDNNCQDFLISLLSSNNLGTPQDMAFVKQDTKSLFEDLPYLRKFANTLTDIGAKVSAIVSGGSLNLVNRKRLTKNIISDNNILMPQFKDTRFQPPTDYVIPQNRFEMEDARFFKAKPKMTGMGRGKKMSGMGRKKMSGCDMCPMCSGSGMCGSGFFDDIGRAFRSVGDQINDAVIQPIKKGVENEIIAPVETGVRKTFTPKLGRDITSGLIHQALPAVISAIASSGTTALTGNPALGFAVGQTAGKYAGKKAGDELGKATGYGLKKPNAWIEMVKKVQRDQGVSYKEAMTIASKMRKN